MNQELLQYCQKEWQTILFVFDFQSKKELGSFCTQYHCETIKTPSSRRKFMFRKKPKTYLNKTLLSQSYSKYKYKLKHFSKKCETPIVLKSITNIVNLVILQVRAM